MYYIIVYIYIESATGLRRPPTSCALLNIYEYNIELRYLFNAITVIKYIHTYTYIIYIINEWSGSRKKRSEIRVTMNNVLKN